MRLRVLWMVLLGVVSLGAQEDWVGATASGTLPATAVVKPPAFEGVLADRVLRYVNGGAITVGDLRLRDQLRVGELQRGRQDLPKTTAQRQAFSQASLDELTDERLLEQEADRLQIVLDKSLVAKVVMERARQTGRGLELAAQGEERRRLERSQRVEAVLEFYDDRTHVPARSEIRAAYAARQGQFLRPALADVQVWALRPSHVNEQREVKNKQLAIMRDSQGLTDPLLLAAATQAQATVLARGMSVAKQEAAIQALCEIIADAAARSVPAADMPLVRRAVELREMAARLQDEGACEQRGFALVNSLTQAATAARSGIFAEAARVAQGPNGVGGGVLEKIEPGLRGALFDTNVFSLPAGGFTKPFWDQGALWVVLVNRIEPARQRPLAEVETELESVLREERSAMIRNRLVATLRARAQVRDMVDLRELLK